MTLLDHEMLFVTGKGGVGKTTVAAALGLAAAKAGRRTIVCELAGQAKIPALMGVPAGEPSEEVHLVDGLWATTIESWHVLEEWIGRVLGSRALTGLLTHTNFFRAFAEAAPGGLELGEIVKTWELVDGHRWQRGRRGYDLVIVDGPATGHALGMLGTPGMFAEIARVGPIAAESRRVRDWLADPARTAFVGVALPGELPVAETIDLDARLEAQLGRRLDLVLVNGVLPDRFSTAELEAVEQAAPAGSPVPDVVAAARHRAEEQAAHVARVRAALSAPVHTLPFVFAPDLRFRHLKVLADDLPEA